MFAKLEITRKRNWNDVNTRPRLHDLVSTSTFLTWISKVLAEKYFKVRMFFLKFTTFESQAESIVMSERYWMMFALLKTRSSMKFIVSIYLWISSLLFFHPHEKIHPGIIKNREEIYDLYFTDARERKITRNIIFVTCQSSRPLRKNIKNKRKKRKKKKEIRVHRHETSESSVFNSIFNSRRTKYLSRPRYGICTFSLITMKERGMTYDLYSTLNARQKENIYIYFFYIVSPLVINETITKREILQVRNNQKKYVHCR